MFVFCTAHIHSFEILVEKKMHDRVQTQSAHTMNVLHKIMMNEVQVVWSVHCVHHNTQHIIGSCSVCLFYHRCKAVFISTMSATLNSKTDIGTYLCRAIWLSISPIIALCAAYTSIHRTKLTLMIYIMRRNYNF